MARCITVVAGPYYTFRTYHDLLHSGDTHRRLDALSYIRTHYMLTLLTCGAVYFALGQLCSLQVIIILKVISSYLNLNNIMLLGAITHECHLISSNSDHPSKTIRYPLPFRSDSSLRCSVWLTYNQSVMLMWKYDVVNRYTSNSSRFFTCLSFWCFLEWSTEGELMFNYRSPRWELSTCFSAIQWNW